MTHLNKNCCIAKDGGLTNMNKGCAERNRCLPKCHNCGSLLVLVPAPENLDHDIAGRVKQGLKMQMCGECNIPHFEATPIGKLFYYTNEERWRAHIKELEELRHVSFLTMKSGQKWYSWMPDKPENKTLYYSIFR